MQISHKTNKIPPNSSRQLKCYKNEIHALFLAVLVLKWSFIPIYSGVKYSVIVFYSNSLAIFLFRIEHNASSALWSCVLGFSTIPTNLDISNISSNCNFFLLLSFVYFYFIYSVLSIFMFIFLHFVFFFSLQILFRIFFLVSIIQAFISWILSIHFFFNSPPKMKSRIETIYQSGKTENNVTLNREKEVFSDINQVRLKLALILIPFWKELCHWFKSWTLRNFPLAKQQWWNCLDGFNLTTPWKTLFSFVAFIILSWQYPH